MVPDVPVRPSSKSGSPIAAREPLEKSFAVCPAPDPKNLYVGYTDAFGDGNCIPTRNWITLLSLWECPSCPSLQPPPSLYGRRTSLPFLSGPPRAWRPATPHVGKLMSQHHHLIGTWWDSTSGTTKSFFFMGTHDWNNGNILGFTRKHPLTRWLIQSCHHVTQSTLNTVLIIYLVVYLCIYFFSYSFMYLFL